MRWLEKLWYFREVWVKPQMGKFAESLNDRDTVVLKQNSLKNLLPELFVPSCSLCYCNYFHVIQMCYPPFSACCRVWTENSFRFCSICVPKNSNTDFPSAFQSQGLSTYKELCSLASDLNQPDLVYKFMNLANHHAMWNSRKVMLCFHATSIPTVNSGNKTAFLYFWLYDLWIAAWGECWCFGISPRQI